MVARWWRSAAVLVALAGTPAHADAYEMRITGAGFKGFESCAFDADVAISATGVIDSGHHAGQYTFMFFGRTRTCGQTETGGGALSGDLSGGVSYDRTGPHLQLFGHVSLQGTTVLFNAACAYIPTNVNPTSSFNVVCVASDTAT